MLLIIADLTLIDMKIVNKQTILYQEIPKNVDNNQNNLLIVIKKRNFNKNCY